MKYKVSLLPEARKKRIVGKQKVEKYKTIVVSLLVVLVALFAMVLISKIYSDVKLARLIDNNDAYMQKVETLSKYRTISDELDGKMKLIESIQVEEPYLHQFVVEVGNKIQPGISISSIECTDWKVARQCIINGTCNSRAEFIKYKQALEKSEYVDIVTEVEFVSAVGTDNGLCTFSLQINAKGGTQVPDLAINNSFEVGTTVVDANAGVQE